MCIADTFNLNTMFLQLMVKLLISVTVVKFKKLLVSVRIELVL